VKILKRLLGYGLLIGVFVGGFYAVNRSQDIIDWYRLRDYVPTERIAQISDSVSLNEYGQTLFYVNDPAITSDKQQFAVDCRTSNEIIVLGCHVTNGGIFLFDVEDERLNGIVEVTAAHEMLHAGYDRLAGDEKERVITMLNRAYEDVANDRIRKTISAYESRDPSVVPNELHSILGSEVKDLPKELEDYYSQYFNDRSQVVVISNEYEAEFIKRQDRIEAFDAQLDELNSNIVRLEAQLTTDAQNLASRRSQLESQRGNPEQFNAGVRTYNAQVNQYNEDIEVLRGIVAEYNGIVAQRNDIAIEERELNEAIDSRIDAL